MEWVGLFAVGLLVGAVNAVAGAGMIFGFPALVANGMLPLVANATGKIIAVPGQITAAFGFRSFGRVLPKQAFFLLVPAAIGSIIGALLLVVTPAKDFAFFVPYLILAAVIIFLLEEFWQRHEDRVKSAPHPPAPFWLLSFFMLVGSIYGGYFGVGFGYIVLAILSVGDFGSIHEMNLIKNLVAIVIAVTSIVTFLPSGLIDWTGGIAMMIGATIGGYLAAWVAPKLPLPVVRFTIGVFGIGAAIFFFVNGV